MNKPRLHDTFARIELEDVEPSSADAERMIAAFRRGRALREVAAAVLAASAVAALVWGTLGDSSAPPPVATAAEPAVAAVEASAAEEPTPVADPLAQAPAVEAPEVVASLRPTVAEPVRGPSSNSAFTAAMTEGFALRQRGEGWDAMLAFARAADLRPQAAEPRFAMGQYYASRGAPETAAIEFEKALALDPNYQPARAALCRLSGASSELDARKWGCRQDPSDRMDETPPVPDDDEITTPSS